MNGRTYMKYLILGAGPAGLAFANKLKQSGETSFLVLEGEKTVGGLCRSTMVDGFPFDIGGGHFLDTRDEGVNNFLFDFMPKDKWKLFKRNSLIDMGDSVISHPIEANIWQFNIQRQVEYLKSIAQAGCNTNEKMPTKFIEWIRWKLGDKIAEDYMIPYNEKIFGNDLNLLGTYWLEKLPNVSFDETLLSCLVKCAYGKQPAHETFWYPKQHGYGELWIQLGERINQYIRYNQKVVMLDFDNNIVETETGEKYHGDMIITTIPWNDIKEFNGMPLKLRNKIKKLRFSSIVTCYHSESLDSTAHWIYYPDLCLPYHRILLRNNFCEGSKGYWTETNAERFKKKKGDIYFYNKYAYPLNTVEKPQIMKMILSWAEGKNVYGLGRWGEYQHYNSDITVRRALELAERVIN